MTDRQPMPSMPRSVTKNKKITVAKFTFELSISHANPISIQTVRKELQKLNIHGYAAISKPHVNNMNARKK